MGTDEILKCRSHKVQLFGFLITLKNILMQTTISDFMAMLCHWEIIKCSGEFAMSVSLNSLSLKIRRLNIFWTLLSSLHIYSTFEICNNLAQRFSVFIGRLKVQVRLTLKFIHLLMVLHKLLGGSPHGIIDSMLDCDIIVNSNSAYTLTFTLKLMSLRKVWIPHWLNSTTTVFLQG